MFSPTCLFCGCRPCSVDAAICPHCGHADPNPGLRTRAMCIINSFGAVLSAVIVGGIFTFMAGSVHVYAGAAVAACFLLGSGLYVARAVWYAVDPTLSIFPRPRAGW